GHPVDVRRAIDFAPRATCADLGRARFRIGDDAAQPRQIDDESVVANAEPSRVVSAPANGDEDSLGSAGSYGLGYVRRSSASDDRGGVLVDHAVVDAARAVVFGMARRDDRSAEIPAQTIDQAGSIHRRSPRSLTRSFTSSRAANYRATRMPRARS